MINTALINYKDVYCLISSRISLSPDFFKLLTLFFLLFYPLAQVQAISPGEKLPDSIASQIGPQITYIDIWASWCGPCRESMPFMADLESTYKSLGLKVLAVNVDSERKDAESFLAKTPLKPGTIVFDPEGQFPIALELKVMPTSYLVDSNGVVYKVFSGFDNEHKTEIKAAIDSLLKRTATTKP